ncbi:MAG: DUF3566 domain-containing protein [Candidatus Marinimicrobia bacterium]|nr:DUF3566 domain-containing protein [Candidatus Neomarinimicrobiota bacterium]
MKYELKSIELWSIVRTIFLVSLAIHLILGMGLLLILLIGMNVSTSLLDDNVQYYDDIDSFGLPIGPILVIVISIGASTIYSLFYFAIGALYNLFSGWLGGIEITLEERVQSVKTVLIPKENQVSEDDESEEDSPEE